MTDIAKEPVPFSRDVTFSSAELLACDLSRTRLCRATLRECRLEAADDLQHACASCMSYRRANLSDTDRRRDDLTSARFDKAFLEKAPSTMAASPDRTSTMPSTRLVATGQPTLPVVSRTYHL